MNRVFPSISTVSIKETEAGSIVKLSRSPGSILALVTNHITNDARSIVLLNLRDQNRPGVIFIDNWRNENALRYNDNVCFEVATDNDEIDINGRHSWETPGVIVSIGDELFIRAAPSDSFYDSYKLVNIRSGALFPDRPLVVFGHSYRGS